jgi:RNA recognition motif-containing protein
MTRIYVGNVYRELSEPEIQTVFEAFGPIRSCKFIPNPENGVGKHKGFGFIEYVDPAAAASAVQAMNGFTLAVRHSPLPRSLHRSHADVQCFAQQLAAGPRCESGMGPFCVIVFARQCRPASSRCDVRSALCPQRALCTY